MARYPSNPKIGQSFVSSPGTLYVWNGYQWEQVSKGSASGYVNAGTFVTLDNIKATVTSSGNRGLSIAAVLAGFTANISAMYGYSTGSGGISISNYPVTTTATSSLLSWNFSAEGDGSTYIINDKTNNIVYRITMMIGSLYNNNFISIERLI